LPGASEPGDNVFESALSDDNLAGLIGSVPRDEAEGREDDGPQKDEVK
jgi:hypothetical protein